MKHRKQLIPCAIYNSLKCVMLIASAILVVLVGGTYASRAQDATLVTQQAYIKASNTGGPSPGETGVDLGVGDNFGRSVAISGDTMVIGAVGEDSNATGANGIQTNNSARNSGAAYVFVRDGTNWVQQAYLKASNTGAGDFFGGSVAISGDTIVVGAYYEDSSATGVNGNQTNNSATDSGAAYVFAREGTNWSQQAYLKASNTGAGDFFGYSVAVYGDTVVVGAYGEDSNATGVNGNQSSNSASFAGAAYVFVRDGTNWIQQAYLKASNTGGPLPGEEVGDAFGIAVAVFGDTIAIGAGEEDSNARGINGSQNNNSAPSSGAVYVFVRNGTNWDQQAYVKASNSGSQDDFGYSVALSDNTLVVGAHKEASKSSGVNGNQSDNSAMEAGAAYVFVRNGTNWSQQAYLKASNPDGLDPRFGAGDDFGWSVAVFGDTVVVGAVSEAGNATGVNGDQSDNNAPLAGAAYVFVRSATNWSQQAYLKPSNTRTFDGFSLFGVLPDSAQEFGVSVAISGDTVVVGADQDLSNATGVNGNQSNTNATFSGAAYVFTHAGAPPPQLTIERSASNVQISWPIVASGFGLQETTDINPSSTVTWTSVPLPYQTNATSVSVTLPLDAQDRFYRLRKP